MAINKNTDYTEEQETQGSKAFWKKKGWDFVTPDDVDMIIKSNSNITVAWQKSFDDGVGYDMNNHLVMELKYIDGTPINDRPRIPS